MTAPFLAVGSGATPAFAALEISSAPSGAPSGTPATAVGDPLATVFAGLLARFATPQPASNAKGKTGATTMVDAAFASLEAAVAEAAPAADAGSSAIRALVEEVSRNAARAPGPAIEVASPEQEKPPVPASNEQEVTGAEPLGALPPVAPIAPMVDPSSVAREVGALDPAFRAKLERVVERMQAEFGHKVTITESVRSQVRQDALYEQGRTLPGQVVTWTRASRHTDGLAVDVMIDGGYDNPVAFARLQRVANEEGIHTLGARDPGHLELRTPQPGGFTAKIGTAMPEHLTLRPAPGATAATAAHEHGGNAALARVARVARVAEVAVTARVARVAAVAHVAVPGAATRVAISTPTPATAPATAPAMAPAMAPATTPKPTPQSAPAPAGAPKGGEAKAAAVVASATQGATGVEMPSVAVQGGDAASKSTTRDRAHDPDAHATPRTTTLGVDRSDVVAMPFAAPTHATVRAGVVDAIAAPDQASRVERIDTLAAQAAAQPVSSMVLTMDDGNGGTDRVRVDVRGTSVASSIEVRDQQSAAELSARTGELTRALEAHGLEADSVRVRAVAAERPGTDALRSALGGSAASTRSMAGVLNTEASNPSRRERDDSRDPRGSSSQSQQDSHRQRSRRDREEDPQ